MSRPAFHRPPGSRLVEVIGVVALGRRKGLQFSIVEENGVRLGEILHCAITPLGRPVVPTHPQRVVMAEPVAAKFIEAAASIGVRLRGARS